MLLGIKTDTAIAEFVLYDNQQCIGVYSWEADRELARHLLAKIQWFLHEHTVNINDVKGLFVFSGPGSFTGLRIGCTVMNTLAYGLTIPIVACSGSTWQQQAVEKLQAGKNDNEVIPDYGASPRVTQQKK